MDSDLQFDNLPNRLTLFRLVLVPIVVVCLWAIKMDWAVFGFGETEFGLLAAGIFFLASATDFFDGYVARKRNLVTVFGSFLDPIADKFLVVSSLIMLLSLNRVFDSVVIILVLRELYMTSLRLLASSEGLSVPVNWMGKAKTATQMLAIPCLMIHDSWKSIPFDLIGDVLILISAGLSLFSALFYSAKLVRNIKQRRILLRQNK